MPNRNERRVRFLWVYTRTFSPFAAPNTLCPRRQRTVPRNPLRSSLRAPRSPLVVAVNEAPTIPAAVPPPPQLEPVPPPSPPQAPVPPPQVPATPPPSLRVPLTCIGNGLTPRKSRPPPPLDETAPLVAENVPPAVRHNRPSTGRVVGPYNLRRLR